MSGKDELTGWAWLQGLRPVAFYEGEDDGDGDGDDDGAADDGKGGDDDTGAAAMLKNAPGDDDGDGAKGGDDDWAKVAEKLGVDAEHIGKSPEDTVKALQGRIKGFRDQIAKGNKSGDVPESADQYTIEPSGDDDIVAPYLQAEENAPIFEAFQQAAHAHGMPKGAFQGFMRDGLQAAHDSGLIDLRDEETAIAESGKVEMEALVKAIGKEPAIDMMNSVINGGKEMAESGQMPKEWLDEWNIMGGTHVGAQILYSLMTGKRGMKPSPHGQPMEGAKSVEDADDALRTAMAMKPGAERDRAIREAEADQRKAYEHMGQGTSVALDMG